MVFRIFKKYFLHIMVSLEGCGELLHGFVFQFDSKFTFFLNKIYFILFCNNVK